jgi:signal transduction histidine kinase/CheY-like chemotaxis protein
MASSLGKHNSETTLIIEELVRESLRVLLVGTVIVVWVWTALALLFIRDQAGSSLAILALVLVSSWVSYYLSSRYLSPAIGVYLLGFAGAVTIEALTFQNPVVLFLYAQMVLVTAVLTNPWVTWGTALASVVVVWGIGWEVHAVPVVDVVPPIVFILLTALASWLSSQRLFTALAWALTMTKQAQESAEEARRRRAEVRRMLKSLDEAYVRLERANEALLFAREAAKKAYRFKAEFVANVSHELRTPLNLIVGFSEMMATAPESYGGVPLPREYRGDVLATYRSARHLSDLIDDVLDLSRIEAGRMPLVKETTDLGEVVREATDMVRGLAEARGLWLELDGPKDLPKLHLDRTRIRQVLLNLLTNATRFTDDGGIQVHTHVEEEEVVVVVQDTGRGIPPDRLARAFEPFTQLDDDQVREGSWMGLAVSKRFVELHGGKMWIESEPGEGTTIGFTLPVPRKESVPLARLKASTPLASRSAQPTVLVLHDEPRTLSLLRRHIGGYQFVLADTVDKAREVVREVFPVAVVMDAMWADRWAVNGSELGLFPHTPLITCPLPSMRRLGLLLGAVDYLPKPVTREDLQSALARLPGPPETVLVVDDNPHVVRLLARMLKANYPSVRVLEAFGGREGLEIARLERPDAILLDLLMPEMDGYTFLEEITEDGLIAETQIIIVSVRSVEEESPPVMGELQVGRAAGFSLTELLQTLGATLSTVTRSVAQAPSSAGALPEAQLG